jgi:DNA adenine methylase
MSLWMQSGCTRECDRSTKVFQWYMPSALQLPVTEVEALGSVEEEIHARLSLVTQRNGNIKPILKYPGAKWSRAKWIISHFQPHVHYIEPYCGSAAVFFTKQPSRHEVLNDLNCSIINLFTIMRTRPEELARAIMLSPWSESEYHKIERRVADTDGDDLEHARRFLIRSWQSHGGTISQVSGFKHNGISATVYPTQLWKKLPERLLQASFRLLDAEVRSRPALEIIDYYNSPDCLLYVDPPYELSTRARKYYSHEMDLKDHRDLLEALARHKGICIVSGYAHPLYDEMLPGWSKVETPSVTEHGNVRMEVLWLNSKAQHQQMGLFD